MAPISLRGVEKRFGEVTALARCDLEIDDHEFLVLVGPSGSGKTTLLRIIAGLEEATAGETWFGESQVDDLDVGDRDIAMVFQNYGLYPHMSVYGNMAFGLRRRKLTREAIEEKVRATAKLLGIDALLDRKPKQLSGGQRQRVALGRAIVRDPAVFLLDEPLSNLDAHLRVQMRAEILSVHRAVTATAVYVTHDQIEAMTMGDRIAVMNHGEIQQVGTPDELYDRPVNRFVAGFIGTPAMGFLEVERDPQASALRSDQVSLALTDEQAAALPADTSSFVAGIRPEHLRLDRDQPDGSTVTGRVSIVEPLGSEQHVVVDVAGQLVTARLPREDKVEPEATVTFTVPAGRFHVFDVDTGIAYR
ncbi:MAG: sn-glycerol-3-phosphate ABC transporter ATP-binding protein UgpC [Streptosporangiales bacterium]|nr:sn-glycerol-3-phosphate ABC transporter ATP-binding protein UgpC [Streptosporangiales bacterium]